MDKLFKVLVRDHCRVEVWAKDYAEALQKACLLAGEVPTFPTFAGFLAGVDNTHLDWESEDAYKAREQAYAYLYDKWMLAEMGIRD